MKHGDGALTGPQGIEKHLEHLRSFLKDSSRLTRLKNVMREVFNQKRKLGFIANQNDITSFEEDQKPPVWLLVLVLHFNEDCRGRVLKAD